MILMRINLQAVGCCGDNIDSEPSSMSKMRLIQIFNCYHHTLMEFRTVEPVDVNVCIKLYFSGDVSPNAFQWRSLAPSPPRSKFFQFHAVFGKI